jgi:hypothetical protein
MRQTIARLVTVFTITSIVLLSSSFELSAQLRNGGRNNRVNRDPAQELADRLSRYRERLEVTSDEDWKALQPKIQKVLQAQQELRATEARRNRGGFRNQGQRNGNSNTTDVSNRSNRRNQTQSETPDAATETHPDVAAVKSALDNQAPSAEMQKKLSKLQETRKQKKAELTQAQSELRQALTVRQQALATLSNLL